MAALAIGCGAKDTTDEVISAPEGSLIAEPLQAFPERFSDVGLYPVAGDLSQTPWQAHYYEPAWPLWSNGSAKLRYISVPEGVQVDTLSPRRWEFPVGTLLFKTFTFPKDGRDVPYETRVIRRGEDDFEFASYQWQGDDAVLLDGKTSVGVMVQAPTGEELEHRIPSKLECRQCHESGNSRVLGFSEVQLARQDGRVRGSHMEAAFGVGILDSMPNSPEHVEADDEATQQFVGYLQGNCVHCHNGGGGVSSSFDMQPGVALANLVGKNTESSASAAGIRIDPGSPETSILFLAFSGETDNSEVKPMPPLGVQLRDQAAVEMMRSWVRGLK